MNSLTFILLPMWSYISVTIPAHIQTSDRNIKKHDMLLLEIFFFFNDKTYWTLLLWLVYERDCHIVALFMYETNYNWIMAPGLGSVYSINGQISSSFGKGALKGNIKKYNYRWFWLLLSSSIFTYIFCNRRCYWEMFMYSFFVFCRDVLLTTTWYWHEHRHISLFQLSVSEFAATAAVTMQIAYCIKHLIILIAFFFLHKL